MLADHLAFINRLSGADKQSAALLQILQGVGGRPPGFRGDHDAVGPARDAATQRLIIIEVMVHDRLAARGVKQARPQTDQATGRDRELHVGYVAAPIQLETTVATDS